MDPDANLREVREIIASWLADDDIDVERLAELVEAMDGWLSRGGALPRAWMANRTEGSAA